MEKNWQRLNQAVQVKEHVANVKHALIISHVSFQALRLEDSAPQRLPMWGLKMKINNNK